MAIYNKWYDYLNPWNWFKSLSQKIYQSSDIYQNMTEEQQKELNDKAENVEFKDFILKVPEQIEKSFKDTINTIEEGIQQGVQGLTETFIDPLTGQTAENERTHETNEYNLKQVQETNQTNRDIAESTNETNKAIATENLQYQRELQEYNKALQERIFNREDTAYQRTKKDMLEAGLNPLTMQGINGAGEAIALSPLNNSYNAQMGSPMQAHQNIKANHMGSISTIAPQLLSVIQGVNSLKSGQLQRDSIALENDRKSIENYILARRYGIDYSEYNGSKYGNRYKMKIPNDKKTQVITDQDYWEAGDKQREIKHKIETGRYDSDTEFEKILTALDDWFISGRAESEWKKISDKYPTLKLFEDFIKDPKGYIKKNWR